MAAEGYRIGPCNCCCRCCAVVVVHVDVTAANSLADRRTDAANTLTQTKNELTRKEQMLGDTVQTALDG